jgi:hypothetical protein
MRKRLSSVSVTCAAMVVLLGLATSANADALYFEKGAVKTSSERTCLKFAGDVARNQGFKNTHSNALEVAGEKDGAYVAITCVGRGQQPAMVIVMAVAPTFDKAKQVGSFVAGRVKAITCIDSPC